MQEKIGAILRKEREKAGLTIEEVCLKLEAAGKKISPKTLYGYENDVSSPKISVFMSLCRLYEIDDVYGTFNMRAVPSESAAQFNLSAHEREVILAYRSRPDMQPAVDRLLELSAPAPDLKWAARGKRVPQDGPVDEKELEQALSQTPSEV